MKAPRSKPNSSDSSSSAGSAAQLTLTNVRSRRGEASWTRARHQLFAGAALAADEHRDVGVGDAIDQLAHLAHLAAGAEQLAVETRVAARRRRVVIRRGACRGLGSRVSHDRG